MERLSNFWMYERNTTEYIQKFNAMANDERQTTGHFLHFIERSLTDTADDRDFFLSFSTCLDWQQQKRVIIYSLNAGVTYSAIDCHECEAEAFV